MPGSTPETPINCDVDFDSSNVAGKTAVVTGGANGLGEAYVRALHAAKANVFIGDMNQEDGGKLASELTGTQFIKCDVTKWEDQLRLFQEAEAKAGKIHYVVANAGIASNDDVFSFDGPDSTPTEPRLNIIDVNMRGVLYTVKLAMHYFIKLNGKTPSPSQVDTCLILIGSGAAFLDVPRGPQYSGTKWGIRGVMHSLRRTAHFYGSRVNMLSPWYGTLTPSLTPHDPNWSRYVRTKILTEASFDHVENCGVQMATTQDAGQALLRLLSDTSINGRSLFISPRKWAPRGYLDLNVDEYPGNDLVEEIQADQLRSAPVDLRLFIEKGSKYTMQR